MKKYNVIGMSCAACSSRVEKAVMSVEGVTSCSVNLLTNSMAVSGTASDDEIINAVIKAGYNASAVGNENAVQKNNSNSSDKNRTDNLIYRLVFSLLFLLILMYISMGHTMFAFPLPKVLAESANTLAVLQMLLTIIIMIINQRFFISGYRSIVHRSPNMDTLVSIGAISAFGYSLAVVFDMLINNSNHLHDLYFESAAMILTLITLGKMLEARAKGKTTSAIEGLMALSPQTATIIQDGKEVVVNIDKVVIGDIFIVKPGETIPVDGKVIEGISSVDESALTGESIPIDKTADSPVYAATINQSGHIRCKATKVGEDTTLAQIIQVVNDAAASKAPISKIADKVSGIFVPIVIAVSVVTLIVWLMLGKAFGYSLARAISVLVISCPCALGLATPVAIMVGSGLGAKNGILFKTATALELTGKAKIIAFDKTGTITEGKPKVTDILTYNQISETELLQIANSIESYSEHPLAKAIVQYANSHNISSIKISDFKAYPGNGISAKINQDTVYCGNIEFIESTATVNNEIIRQAEQLASDGKTPIYFCKNNKIIGLIGVADTVKEDAPASIKKLKKLGFHIVMITGDNERTAKAIADSSGIDEIYHGVHPDKKEHIIRKLQNHGKVIMVGDGINDAPALTRADIGIAVGTGTDIAIDAADVVLMNSTLNDVVSAVNLSRSVIKTIYENLFWAFSYNIIGIPLAAGVFISWLGFEMNPMFGAAAMSISSFLVVINALRLNLLKLSKKENYTNTEEKLMKKQINIEGMMCGHCEARVKQVLEAIDGVTDVYVSHEQNIAKIKVSDDVSDNTIKSLIEEQGYTVLSIDNK